MAVAVVTGSAGLVGASAAQLLSRQGLDVLGIDNDMRRYYFGKEASTRRTAAQLAIDLPRYTHHDLDIRSRDGLETLFERHRRDIAIVVHAAAQPSHDWAATEPLTDFAVNALGTLNLLELTRLHAPEASFVYVSTNKVYGDTPNRLPLVEGRTRWEIDAGHRFSKNGIDESMSVDQTLHSLFGTSKLSADLMVQEYGRYFSMNTVCFRAGCITGSRHEGAELHGFLSYLIRCALTGRPYTVFGHGGKQVRDNIHAEDLVEAFWLYHLEPRPGEVYNVGGGRHSNCSIVEVIALLEETFGLSLRWTSSEKARIGDHRWWISDTGKLRSHYPRWRLRHDVRSIVCDMVDAHR